jgi:hypothetical protein
MTTATGAAGVRVNEPAPEIVALTALPSDKCLMSAVTERGRFGPFEASSFKEWVNEYGTITTDSLDAVVAAQGYFENGGTALITSRVTHYTDLTDPNTNASVAATINITTATTQTYGSVTTGNTETFRLDPADTLVIKVDGGGGQTATWDAAQAAVESSGCNPTGFSGGETLTLDLDNSGITQTITFQAADITVALAAQRINNLIEGGYAEVTSAGAEITIASDVYGTDSDVEIIGGTGRAALGFSVGSTAGTGDVGNIREVTATEIQTRVVADTTLTVTEVTIAAGAVTFSTPTIGAGGSIQIDATSTADDAAKLDLDNAVHSGTAAGAGNMATADAKSDGDWANGWDLVVSDATNGDSDYFDLAIQDTNDIVKRSWPNVITTLTDDRYFETIVNDDPENYYVVLTDLLSGTAPANRPTNGTYTLAGGDSGLGALADTDFVGNSAGPTGFFTFDVIPNARTLIVPGKGTSTVHNGMITYCDTWRNKEIVALADPPALNTEAQVRTYFVTTASLKGASESFYMTWPRGHVANPRPAVITDDDKVGPNNQGVVNVPLSGHTAGMWARNDQANAGVYQPPASVDLPLNGVLGLEILSAGQTEHPVQDKVKRGKVYDDRINPIMPGGGAVYVDGTKMSKSDGNFNTIGQRRGASHIKLTIEVGIPWSNHKNIKPPLLRKIDRTVSLWLDGQTRAGAFVSDDPAVAYNFNVGLDLNPPSVQATGTIKSTLGLAFAFPADYVDVDMFADTRRFEEELARG